MIVADKAILYARFKQIGGDWLAEKLTPAFANRAGQKLVEPHGVDLAFETAFINVCADLPEPAMLALSMHENAIKQALAATEPEEE